MTAAVLAALNGYPHALRAAGISATDCAGHSACTLPADVWLGSGVRMCENHARVYETGLRVVGELRGTLEKEKSAPG